MVLVMHVRVVVLYLFVLVQVRQSELDKLNAQLMKEAGFVAK